MSKFEKFKSWAVVAGKLTAEVATFALEYTAALNRLGATIEDEIGRGRREFDLEVNPHEFSPTDEPDPTEIRRIILRVEEALVQKYPIACVNLNRRSDPHRAILTFEVDS